MALREAVCCCRCVWEQPGRAGVRVADPQGHPAALRVPADGAQEDHPVWPQRHGQDLPGQQAVRVPGAQGGQGAGRGHHRHLQRGPQIQQGERAQTRPRAEAVPSPALWALLHLQSTVIVLRETMLKGFQIHLIRGVEQQACRCVFKHLKVSWFSSV